MMRRSTVRTFLVLGLVAGGAIAQVPGLPPMPPSAAPTAAPTPPALSAAAASALPLAPGANAAAPSTAAGQTAVPITVADIQALSAKPATSMGNSTLTILFAPIQIKGLREALLVFESKRTDSGKAGDLNVDFAQEEKPKITEPATYPVFYLSSIAYNSPTDWTVWVSGRKITSVKNPTTLKVTRVSADRASFSWLPEYPEAIAMRVTNHLFASTDPVKNKLTVPSTYHYDDKTGEITFSLLTNQSFVAGYFDTFEGFVASPPLVSLAPPDKKDAKTGAAPAAAAPALPNAGAGAPNAAPTMPTISK